MSGPARKPVELRQRRNAPQVPDLRLVRGVDPPAAPTGILKRTKLWWRVFWASDLAQATHAPTDIEAIYRLATLYDERERCYRVARRQRLVEGSQGQLVLNPLYAQMINLDKEIRALEDRFGLTPRARLNLGIQLGQIRRTVDDLNRELEVDLDEIILEAAIVEDPDSGPVGVGMDRAKPRSRSG